MWHQALRPLWAAVSVAAVCTVALGPGSALAHEHGTIGGLQFPVARPDPAQAAAVARDAQAEAQSARTLAGLGIGVGVLGLLAALGGWATRPRAAATTTTTRPAGEPI